MIRITGMKWAPSFAQGQVRDLRLRWALKEAGIAYEVRLIDAVTMKKSEEYRRQQPFGQVPVFEEDGRVIFESGAALLDIARRGETLLPRDAGQRDQALCWVFAALNSVEPFLMNLAEVDFFMKDEEQKRIRRPVVIEALEGRLRDLAAALGQRNYLAGDFTVADLLMTTVLRIAGHTDVLAGFPALEDFRQRCEARPAFQEALAEQLADFGQHAPADMRYREAYA